MHAVDSFLYLQDGDKSVRASEDLNSNIFLLGRLQGDAELEAIRQRRMAELMQQQQQGGGSEEDQKAAESRRAREEEERRAMLAAILLPEARERCALLIHKSHVS